MDPASPLDQEKTRLSPPDALLNAAFRVFATRGYHGTRLEEVADEAGLTKGAIYYHFEGKEDLLRRAVRYRHATIFLDVERELRQLDAPASVKIRHVLRRLWQHLLEPAWGHTFRLMFGEVGLRFPALFRMWVEEGPIRGWFLVMDLIRGGVERGEFRPDVDPEVASRMIVSGLMLQVALQVHTGAEDLAPCSLDRILDSGMEVWLRGLTEGRGVRNHATTVSTAAPVTESFRPIGHVRSDFEAPTDPETLRSGISRLVIEPELKPGLTGLKTGDRLLVLFVFHRAERGSLLQHPRGDASRPERGVFALRSPRRPNPIGATVVELLAMDGNELEVRGLDALDGSPVLDIKPA